MKALIVVFAAIWWRCPAIIIQSSLIFYYYSEASPHLYKDFSDGGVLTHPIQESNKISFKGVAILGFINLVNWWPGFQSCSYLILLGIEVQTKDNKYYCQPCFTVNFPTICDGCQQPVIGEEKFIKNKGKILHHRCHVCSQCQTSLFKKRCDIFHSHCFSAQHQVKN